ncbi:hypothetical protein CC86DRAFT_409194 [Ophiobolus disseminans]|uniref:Uncharacterized protein n=1 Tax=Ophiobolus disseminans TaxID=1469910 RepID=A0A6A6ZQC4_9PLEO|nr:hypothetical protein CC86DRAFT_409194 [Ophiobolus disseminans]
MRTPHFGSADANVGYFFAYLFGLAHQGNISPLEELNRDGPGLHKLEREFSQLLSQRVAEKSPVEIACFCESLPVGGIVGLARGTQQLIVPPHSAAPPNHENRRTLHADHSSMTKFRSREDPNHKMVVAEIQAMIESFKSRKTEVHDGIGTSKASGAVSHVGNNTHGVIAMYGKLTLGDGARIGE